LTLVPVEVRVQLGEAVVFRTRPTLQLLRAVVKNIGGRVRSRNIQTRKR
jgi:hypothetical protein